MRKFDERIAASIGLAFGLLISGCGTGYIPVKEYASTNIPPSRFKVVSSDYYYMQSPAQNVSLVVFSDTEGTNDFLIATSMHGMTMMYIPKPVKVLEDKK